MQHPHYDFFIRIRLEYGSLDFRRRLEIVCDPGNGKEGVDEQVRCTKIQEGITSENEKGVHRYGKNHRIDERICG